MRRVSAMVTARCSNRGVLEECDKWCICPKRLCVGVENAMATKGKSMRSTLRRCAKTAMRRHREKQTVVTYWCAFRPKIWPLRDLFVVARGKVCASGKNNFGVREISIKNWSEGSQMVCDPVLAMRSNEEGGGVVVNGDEGEDSSIWV